MRAAPSLGVSRLVGGEGVECSSGPVGVVGEPGTDFGEVHREGLPQDVLVDVGFIPGEDVQVAIIMREASARMDGRARALATDHELGQARRIILMGSMSGTTVLSPVLE